MEKKKGRKRVKLAILVVTLVVAGVFVWLASNTMNRSTMYEVARNNVSEARFFMKQHEAEGIRVQFFSGIREKDYQRNGIATPTTEFGLINVEPMNTDFATNPLAAVRVLSGVLRIGEEATDITLERNNYGVNFGADIARAVSAEENIVFELTVGDEMKTFPLVNTMDEESINWERALELAVEEVEDQLGNFGQFEVHVKILRDRTQTKSFWYVQFMNTQAQTLFVAVGADGEVLGSTD